MSGNETVLKRGDRGDNVALWQAWCAVQGFDPQGFDGVFGSNTSVATSHLQRAMGLPEFGVVDRCTMRAAVAAGFVGEIPFIQAKTYSTMRRPSTDWVVLHVMQAPEKGHTAESVANYFKNMPDGRVASAHYNVDADSIVQCVREGEHAYHARVANGRSVGVEQAGYVEQTVEQWADDYSAAFRRCSSASTACDAASVESRPMR